MMMTRCQDHILTENIWFVIWSETSFSGNERRCHGCGTNKGQLNSEDRTTQLMEAKYKSATHQNGEGEMWRISLGQIFN